MTATSFGRVIRFFGGWLRKYPLPPFLINLFLMVRWGCFIHLGAKIGYPGRIRLGRRCVIGRCKISAAPSSSDQRETIVFGERVFIGDGVVLSSQGGLIDLGDCVSVQDYTVVYGLGGVRIGADTRIAASTVIVAHNHVFDDRQKKIRETLAVGRGIRIGQDCWIGAGARILDGVVIGDRAVVGAGAVVVRNVEQETVVGGVPARKLRSRFRS